MYCKKCGRKIDDDILACPYCGTKTERSSENGGGLTNLLQIDAGILAAIIIMIPICLYLIAGRKNESKGNEAQPDVNQAPAYTMAYNGHHYYIYDDGEISFSEASEKCEASGGHLAKIDDEDENERLYVYMLDMGYDQAFFGVIYEESTGEWINYDGTEAVFFDWGTNSAGIEEPNNSGGNEYNVQLDVNMRGGHWNDAEFGAKVYTPEGESYKDRYSYICEWDY